MWSLVLIPVRTPADAFWIRWRPLSELFRNPDNKNYNFICELKERSPGPNTVTLVLADLRKRNFEVI